MRRLSIGDVAAVGAATAVGDATVAGVTYKSMHRTTFNILVRDIMLS